MSETYEGTVVTPTEIDTTKTGKMYARFTIRPKTGPLLNCVCWTSNTQKECDWEALRQAQNKHIIVKGFYGRRLEGQVDIFRGKPPPEKEFVVKWFSVEGQNKPTVSSWHERLVKYYGGEERLKTALAEMYAAKEREGMVRVYQNGSPVWKNRRFCIQRSNGCWEEKIEFLMDAMGVEAVTRELKEWQAKKDMPYNDKLGSLMERVLQFVRA